MRVLIIAILLIVTIIVGWIFTYGSIEKQASELLGTINHINKQIEIEEWQRAKDEFKKVEESWQGIRDQWTILLDHHEIDNIDLSMARANKYISSKDTALSLGELEVLKKLFNIVKENEALTLTNVF